MPCRRTLMVYVEPTTYILDLIHEVQDGGAASVDVLFIAQNVTQKWDVPLQGVSHELLPTGKLAALRTLYGKLSGGGYDVLHLAGWGHPHLLMAMLVAAWLRVPVTMETDTPLLPRRLAGWKRLPKRMVYPSLFRIPARFLPGGTRQAAYLRHYAVKDERIRIAYMTVDIRAISAHKEASPPAHVMALRTRAGIAPGATVFLYVGRMEPYKGVRELLQAMHLLGSDVSCALLLVGDGSLDAEVADAARLDARIRALGRLAGGSLLDAYAMADVFVLPSSSEAWGLVVNEAMAAGLPVIATDQVGCVDDLVVAGQTGMVVPAESPAALASAMRTIHADPRARDELGHNAREHIAPWTVARSATVLRQTWKEVTRCNTAA